MSESGAIRKPLLLLGAMGILTAGYLPALQEIFFIWDGWSWKLCALNWAQDPSLLFTLDPSYSFRPLCRIVYLLLHLTWGDWAPGYLLFVLVLHLAAAWIAGSLIKRLTGDDKAGMWVTFLFCGMSAFTETIQWIASFPHVFLGMEILLFLLLILPEAGDTKVRTKRLLLAAAVLASAMFTREPWVVAAPLMAIVLFWDQGWKGLFSRKGILYCGIMAVCVVTYLYLFRDLVQAERVPGGKAIMAYEIDCFPRLLRSLSQLFVPRAFYANILRSPLGGIVILGALLLLSSLGGKKAFRHALCAMLFVLAALLPFSFYRSPFLYGRYFYVAGVGAVYLIYLSSQGTGCLLGRFVKWNRLSALVPVLLVAAWLFFSLQGIWTETRQEYRKAWYLSKTVTQDLKDEMATLPDSAWICALKLASPSPAVWQCMAGYHFPSSRYEYVLSPDPESLAQELRKRFGPDSEVRYLVWNPEPGYKGRLVRCDQSDALSTIDALTPEPVWGWPKETAARRVGALVVQKQ